MMHCVDVRSRTSRCYEKYTLTLPAGLRCAEAVLKTPLAWSGAA